MIYVTVYLQWEDSGAHVHWALFSDITINLLNSLTAGAWSSKMWKLLELYSVYNVKLDELTFKHMLWTAPQKYNLFNTT